MFKVTANPTFKWKVKFNWAEDNELVEHSFKAIFKRLPAMKVNEMAATVATEGHSIAAQIVFLKDVLVGFEEVEHDGTEKELMDFMLADGAIVLAMFNAYAAAYLGRDPTAKNSDTLLDGS